MKVITSNQMIANGQARPVAQKRSAGDFMSAGESALPGALQQLAGGMGKLNDVVFREEMRKREEDLALQVVKDLNDYAAETQKDNDDFMAAKRFADAEGAEAHSVQFHNSRMNMLREKYQHSPGLLKHIEAQGGAIARGSVNTMRDYGNQQRDLYKQQVIDGRTAGFLDFARRPDASDADVEGRAATLRSEISAMYAGGDPSVPLLKLDNAIIASRKEAEKNRLFARAMQNPDMVPQDLSRFDFGFSSASAHEATQKAITAGVSYRRGARDPGKGEVDCSGWICKLNPHPLVQKGQTAAGIIKEVSKATGVTYGNADLTPDKVREGMLIGMDASSKYAGIDHIVQVIRDPKTGEMMVTESAKGKGGVAITPYTKWYAQWGKSGKVPLTGVVLPGNGGSGASSAGGTDMITAAGPDPEAIGAAMNLKWHDPVEAYTLLRQMQGIARDSQTKRDAEYKQGVIQAYQDIDPAVAAREILSDTSIRPDLQKSLVEHFNWREAQDQKEEKRRLLEQRNQAYEAIGEAAKSGDIREVNRIVASANPENTASLQIYAGRVVNGDNLISDSVAYDDMAARIAAGEPVQIEAEYGDKLSLKDIRRGKDMLARRDLAEYRVREKAAFDDEALRYNLKITATEKSALFRQFEASIPDGGYKDPVQRDKALKHFWRKVVVDKDWAASKTIRGFQEKEYAEKGYYPNTGAEYQELVKEAKARILAREGVEREPTEEELSAVYKMRFGIQGEK